MQQHSLAIADKSVVVCSKIADAWAIVRKVKQCGFVLRAAAQAAYLGGDFGGGRIHARACRVSRDQKHKRMHNKVVRFARAARRYKLTARLEQQGALAAGSYGHQLHGVLGRRMQTMRSYMCDAVAPRRSGRCCTTLLDL